MYGTDSRVTYFGGLSQGGREGLTVANRYPDDYEGVIAGAPVAQMASWTVTAALRAKAQLAPGAWVPASKAVAIRNETMKICDPLDGITDGIISNYDGCPGGADAGDHCLSTAQMATVNSWRSKGSYGYPLVSGDTDYPPVTVGGESGQLLLAKPPTPTMEVPYLPYLRGGFRDKNFNGMDIDLQRDKAKIQAFSNLMDIKSDWSKFLGRGGKLIYITPSHDYLINHRLHYRVWENAQKLTGQAALDRGARFYVSPQSGHGGSGRDAKGQPLPQYVDLITAIENWVENGTAPPEPLVQTLMEVNPPHTVTKSRPLCRAPQYPHYGGSGDPNMAASYTCRAPDGSGAAKSSN
jgi:feruloyl esterase